MVTSVGRLFWKPSILPRGRVRSLLRAVWRSAVVTGGDSAHALAMHHCSHPHTQPQLSSFSLWTPSPWSSRTGGVSLPHQGEKPLDSPREPNQTLGFGPCGSAESHPAGKVCLQTPCLWLKYYTYKLQHLRMPAKKQAELMTTLK